MNEKDCLNLQEVAAYLGVSYKAVWRLVSIGELRAARIGRMYVVRRSDIDALFEGK